MTNPPPRESRDEWRPIDLYALALLAFGVIVLAAVHILIDPISR